MLNITVSGDKELIARIEAMPAAVHAALLRKVTVLALKLEAKIKTDKLSGQVLNVRSGALRRSISNAVEDSSTKITGRAFSSGDVKYAAIHEFGFKGSETVKAHTRVIKQAFGKAISPKTVMVSAFTRQMNMPERSFMRTALADMQGEIVQGLTAAVAEGLKP